MCMEKVSECAECMSLVKEELLSLLNRVSVAASKCALGLERQVYSLKAGSRSGTRLPMGAPGHNTGGLTPGTSFGTATVGTTSLDLTMNTLLSMVQTLDARVQSIADRSRSTGMSFHRLAFDSEAEFGSWLLQHNPKGESLAAFVDMVSTWRLPPRNQAPPSGWWIFTGHNQLASKLCPIPSTRTL